MYKVHPSTLIKEFSNNIKNFELLAYGQADINKCSAATITVNDIKGMCCCVVSLSV